MAAERFNWKERSQLVGGIGIVAPDSGRIVVSRYARLRRKVARYDAVRDDLRGDRRRDNDQVREAASPGEDRMTRPNELCTRVRVVPAMRASVDRARSERA